MMRIAVNRQNIYPRGCITTTWSVDEEGMVKGDEELLMLIALTNLLSGKVKSSYIQGGFLGPRGPLVLPLSVPR